MKRLMYLMMVLLAAVNVWSCGSDPEEDLGGNPSKPDNPASSDVPDNLGMPPTPQSKIDEELLESLSDALVIMSMEMAYAPESTKAKEFAEQYMDVLQQVGYVQQFYPNSVGTRGIWSLGKSSIDFYKACKKTETVYRTALIGAMTINSYDKSKMTELYNELMKSKNSIFCSCAGLKDWTKNNEFYDTYLSTPGKFWYHFSKGDLDSFAPNIYKAICNPQTLSDSFVKSDALHDLALDLVNERLDPNHLMLSAAGPLIEQGFNIVFAVDDVAGAAKLGYDLLNDNTQLIIDVKKGKFDVNHFMTAVNTNLKGLATVVKNVMDLAEKPLDKYTGVKDTDDMFGLILDFVKDSDVAKRVANNLSREITNMLNDLQTNQLRPGSLEYKNFEKRVKDILYIHDGLSAEAAALKGVWQPDAFVLPNKSKYKVTIDDKNLILESTSTKRQYEIHRVFSIEESSEKYATHYDIDLMVYDGKSYEYILFKLTVDNNFSCLTYTRNNGAESDKYYQNGITWRHNKGNELVDLLNSHYTLYEKLAPYEWDYRYTRSAQYTFSSWGDKDRVGRIQYKDGNNYYLSAVLKYVDNNTNTLTYEIEDKSSYPGLATNELKLTITVVGTDFIINDSQIGSAVYNDWGD